MGRPALHPWGNNSAPSREWLISQLTDKTTQSPEIEGTGNGGYGLELGKLSAKYESNGNPGTIANNAGDPGGKSYGAYQLASKMGSVDNFLNWLADEDPVLYSRLINAKNSDGNTYGSNFDLEWKEIAKEQPSMFLNVQHDYIKYAYYDNAVGVLKTKTGFDINSRNLALQNVMWSTAVQHGAGGAVSLFRKIDLTASDEQIINQLYDERSKVDIYFKNCSPNIKNSVYNRFKNERRDALKMLKEGS
jgi:hypothetical protein